MSRRLSVLVVLAVSAVVLTGGLLLLHSGEAKGQEANPYKGSKACATCHPEKHKEWQEMKHSKAWESLTAEQIATGKHGEKACIECHVTGFGKPGGWVSEEKTPGLKGVGCEACHGAGTEHIKTMMQVQLADPPPSEADLKKLDKKIHKGEGCTDCHNPHVDYKKLYGAK
jgi:hypothetical protein